jgi:hypothetical protein
MMVCMYERMYVCMQMLMYIIFTSWSGTIYRLFQASTSPTVCIHIYTYIAVYILYI